MASPLLSFALVGRKSSGKTCLLSALSSARTTNINGISCDLSRSSERYNEYLEQEHVKDFFKSDKTVSYQDMLEHISDLEKALQKGILPNATPLSGKTAYIFNIDTPDKIHFDVGIFDYAGELVEAESKISEALLKFLGKMSGLMVLVEVGDNQEASIKQAAIDITNLKRFFKAIETDSESSTRFNIPIALLVTKFDRFAKLDVQTYEKEGKKYLDGLFEKYLETSQGRNLKDLISSIKNAVSDEYFNVYPTFAFGNVGKGNCIDIPLQSVNILEPITWMAESYAKILLAGVRQNFVEKSFIDIKLLKQLKEQTELVKDLSVVGSVQFVESGNLIAKIDKAIENRSRKEFIMAFGVMGILVVVIEAAILGIEFYFDHSSLFKVRNNPVTLENVELFQRQLEKYANSANYRHLVANYCYFSKTDALALKKEYEKKYDDLYWNDINQTLDEISRLDKLDKYLQIFQPAAHSEDAKKLIEEIFYKLAVNAVDETERLSKFRNYLKQFPNGIYADKVKVSLEELAYNRAVNAPNDIEKVDNLKAYLGEFSDGTHSKLALENLDDYSFSYAKNQPNVDNEVAMLKEYVKAFAKGKHVDEAQELILTAKFNFERDTWNKLADDTEQYIISLKTTNEIDEESVKKASLSIAKLKATYQKKFNSQKRIDNLDKDYIEVSETINRRKIEKHKSLISEAMNPENSPEQWIEGLRLTLEFRSDPTIRLNKDPKKKTDEWADFAGDVVIGKLYENFKLFASNKYKAAEEKIPVLLGAKSSPYRTQIMDIIGYADDSEKIWFDTLIYQIKLVEVTDLLDSDKANYWFEACSKCSDLYEDAREIGAGYDKQWKKFVSSNFLPTLFNKLEALANNTDLSCLDENAKILEIAKNHPKLSSILGKLEKSERKNYSQSNFETLINNTTKNIFADEYNNLSAKARGYGYSISDLISHQADILSRIDNIEKRFSNNSIIKKSYNQYLMELDEYKKCVRHISDKKQIKFWISQIEWPEDHRLVGTNKREVHVEFAGKKLKGTLAKELRGYDKDKVSDFKEEQIGGEAELLPSYDKSVIDCTVIDTTSIKRKDMIIKGQKEATNFDLLGSDNTIHIPLKGVNTGVVWDTDISGSITIRTSGSISITPLRTISSR